MIDKDRKNKVLEKFARSTNDRSSCEAQIGIISERIRQISEHLQKFPKDNHSRLGLLKLVGQRKTFIKYLKENDPVHHQHVMNALKECKYL